MSQGGFFFHEGNYYCTSDYQSKWGTKCGACEKYVEGEVVTALGNTYHQNCFTCARCRKPFPTGTKVTVHGREILCENCARASGTIQTLPVTQTVTDGTRKP